MGKYVTERMHYVNIPGNNESTSQLFCSAATSDVTLAITGGHTATVLGPKVTNLNTSSKNGDGIENIYKDKYVNISSHGNSYLPCLLLVKQQFIGGKSKVNISFKLTMILKLGDPLFSCSDFSNIYVNTFSHRSLQMQYL